MSTNKLSVLIPYREDGGQRDRVFQWILKRYASMIPESQICIGTDDSEPFNRSAARNNAYEQARHEFILIADADTAVEPSAIGAAMFLMQQDPRSWFVPYNWYYNLNEAITEQILRGSPDQKINPTEGQWDHKIESTAGMLIMHRDAWETVGGYDDRFIGWGYEDNSFQIAVDTLWAPHQRIMWGQGLHLWHPVGEHEAFNQPAIDHNRSLYIKYKKAYGNQERMRKVIGPK